MAGIPEDSEVHADEIVVLFSTFYNSLRMSDHVAFDTS
jgi:hypothetical protein